MVQIVEMTHDEKVAMYMKQPKSKLIEMLINCNNLLDMKDEFIDCHLCVAQHNKNKGKIVLKLGSFVLCNDCPGNLHPIDMRVLKTGFDYYNSNPITWSAGDF